MKALVGSWDHKPYRLISENAALRARVADLEEALRRAHEENAVLRATARDTEVSLVDSEVALSR